MEAIKINSYQELLDKIKDGGFQELRGKFKILNRDIELNDLIGTTKMNCEVYIKEYADGVYEVFIDNENITIGDNRY